VDVEYSSIKKMKCCIDGISYFYEIISLANRDKFHFSIDATHKPTCRSSKITTVNPILSELHIPNFDKRFDESVWVVNKKETTHLMNMAKELLSDRSYLTYFESILDEDRKLGEWKNISEKFVK
jgi:hypothetical protein